MKTTEKNIWGLIAFIWICFLILFFSGCRTVKKEYLKENYTSKQETEALSKAIESTKINLENKITEKLLTNFNEKFKSLNTKTVENETTVITGTMEAEQGKDKSVLIGDTKITSNGATITFQTTKTQSKEVETEIKDLSQQLEIEKELNQVFKTDINSLKSEISTLQSSFESEKLINKKEVKTRNISFGIIILLVVFGLFYIFWKIK